MSGINIGAITPYSNAIIRLINEVFVPVLLAIAFLYFVYGVYKYWILGAEKDTERAAGREFVLWSIIAFAVIFSVWGLVNFLIDMVSLPGTGSAPTVPKL